MKELETEQHNQFAEYDRDEFWIPRICNQEGFLEADSRRMTPIDLLTSCDSLEYQCGGKPQVAHAHEISTR